LPAALVRRPALFAPLGSDAARRFVTGHDVDVQRHRDGVLLGHREGDVAEFERGDLRESSAEMPGMSNLSTSLRTSPE
jgi:hypothetical protein